MVDHTLSRKSANPLAEVFGFPCNNTSSDAVHARRYRLCPYSNRVPNCTKDKAENPLGVCSIFGDSTPTITCPIRFRQNWRVASDAAEFFFAPGTTWTSLTEVRLNDASNISAGNIDIVLVSYDHKGQILDFGALEIQAVYISGNVRRPFEYYMEDTEKRQSLDWKGESLYPRPDYLSSSRKRLAPQLLFKGGILNSWGKKVAVALDYGFYKTLPPIIQVEKSSADIAWLVYELRLDDKQNRYILTIKDIIYGSFATTLENITKPKPGLLNNFIEQLQEKLDNKLESPPDTEVLSATIGR